MAPPAIAPPAGRPTAWTRLAIWGGFILLIYLTRDFFFLAFMTFLFSYLALGAIGWFMQRISPNQERPALRRLVTVAAFVLIPIVLLVIGIVILPRLLAEGQRLAGWASQVNPETEVARIMEQYVGPFQFRKQFGDADDPRYKDGLEHFRGDGATHVADYLAFPKLESWIEGGFNRQFSEAETGRLRAHYQAEGTSNLEFGQWFIHVKVPQMQAQFKKDELDHREPDALETAAVNTPPELLLAQIRREPKALVKLRNEWVEYAVVNALAAAKLAPDYRQQFRAYYDERREARPNTVPYTFDQFIELQKVRPEGQTAFGDAVRKMGIGSTTETAGQLRADFETATKHTLFEKWWGTSSIAKYIRQQLESGVSTNSTNRIESFLTSLVNIPIDLATALLLSFFICIDFPALRHGCRQLRETWLRGVYDEIVPALTSLGLLIGRSLRAQGIIACCNATLMFFALTYLGVEHAMLLTALIFVLCLVPTIGMIIAWVLVAGVALIQPGGGFFLALKASVAVFAVVMLETLVFSPRILGRLLELHPVLIIGILPVAHYFFGIWGLVLALPVSVFIINDVILRRPENFSNDAGMAPETPT